MSRMLAVGRSCRKSPLGVRPKQCPAWAYVCLYTSLVVERPCMDLKSKMFYNLADTFFSNMLYKLADTLLACSFKFYVT